jgi:hypothetical protein
MSFFCLAMGPTLWAVILPSLIAYVFGILSLFFLYESLVPGKREERIVGLSFLLAVVLTSPLLLSSAGWAMLEIFGVCLTSLAFAFYFRARRSERLNLYLISAILVFLLWFLKYSYGLFITAVLAVLELDRSRKAVRGLNPARMVRQLLRPVLYPAYIFLVIIALILFAGVKRLTLGSLRISFSNIYNPIMYLYQYLLALSLIMLLKKWKTLRGRLLPGQKELLFWGALPIGIFLALPDKIKALIRNFEAGQKAEAVSAGERLVFFGRSICQDYSLFVPVGILVLVLFFILMLKLKRTNSAFQSLVAFFLAGYLALSLGFNFQESRFIAPFMPALWVVSAGTVDLIFLKIKRAFRLAVAAAIFCLTLYLSLVSPALRDKALAQPWAPWARQGPLFNSFVKPVVERTYGARNVLISGAQDLGITPLLAWKIQSAHYRQRDFRLETDPLNRGALEARFQEKVGRQEYDAIVLFLITGAESDRLLGPLSHTLADSGKYKLKERLLFSEPRIFRIFFFSKTTGLELPSEPAAMSSRWPVPLFDRISLLEQVF